MIERYTDRENDISGFTSVPTMEVDVPENNGTMETQPCEIEMPLDAFFLTISAGLPASPIYVQVQEFTEATFSGDQAELNMLFFGQLMEAERSFEGDNNSVIVRAENIKGRLRDKTLGISCTHECANAFGQDKCALGITLSNVQITGQIDSIAADGMSVTVSTASIIDRDLAATNTKFYWLRGHLEYMGVTLSVVGWVDDNPTLFRLSQRPPDDWVGVDITFTPGCDGSLETCRDVHNNEEYFLGLGYGMLPYHPNYETPSSDNC